MIRFLIEKLKLDVTRKHTKGLDIGVSFQMRLMVLPAS